MSITPKHESDMLAKSSFTSVLMLFFATLSSLLCANEIPFDQTISVIESAEKSLKSAKWDCEVLFNIQVQDVNDVNLDKIVGFSRVDHPIYAKYSVLLDHVANNFIVEGRSCLRWIDGDNPLLSSEFAYSYDGKCYASWQRSKGGNSIPNESDYTDGEISADVDQVRNVSSFLDTKGAYAWFGIGFPGQITLQDDGIYETRALSSVLLEWNSRGFPISIQELSQDKWVIEAKIIIPTGAERVIIMHILPREGIVVFFSRASHFREKVYEELRVEVDVVKTEEGAMVPRSMYVLRPLDRIMDCVTFSCVEINPPVKKDMFSVSFPDGTEVDDYVAKRIYKIGDPINEDRAINDFMVLHGLTGESFLPKRSNTLRCILLGTGVIIIIGIAVYQMMQKRRTA